MSHPISLARNQIMELEEKICALNVDLENVRQRIRASDELYIKCQCPDVMFVNAKPSGYRGLCDHSEVEVTYLIARVEECYAAIQERGKYIEAVMEAMESEYEDLCSSMDKHSDDLYVKLKNDGVFVVVDDKINIT